MKRHFIQADIGEFGFSTFQTLRDGAWRSINLEVDCDPVTIQNFENGSFTYQFWANDQSEFCVASNVFGHKRQAKIPFEMVKKLRVMFIAPAKGGAEFELLIDDERYRGAIMSGPINVQRIDHNWDMSAYYSKKRLLEEMIQTVIKLTNGSVTKTTEGFNC